MPVGDWLELAFADVVFDVQHQEAPRLEHTPAFGPGFEVKGAVSIAPLELAGVARAERPAERVAIGVARAVVVRCVVVGKPVGVGRAGADGGDVIVGVVHLTAVARGDDAARRTRLFGPFRFDLVAVEDGVGQPGLETRDFAGAAEGIEDQGRDPWEAGRP